MLLPLHCDFFVVVSFLPLVVICQYVILSSFSLLVCPCHCFCSRCYQHGAKKLKPTKNSKKEAQSVLCCGANRDIVFTELRTKYAQRPVGGIVISIFQMHWYDTGTGPAATSKRQRAEQTCASLLLVVTVVSA